MQYFLWANLLPTFPSTGEKTTTASYMNEGVYKSFGNISYLVIIIARSSHPYVYETLHIQYPERLFQFAEPIKPASYEATPFTWVDTVEALGKLLAKLREAREIAVDLEYHSMRSYYGFVCLMQISTREEDWVVDTLALREELEVLNEVFTDSGIIKVHATFDE